MRNGTKLTQIQLTSSPRSRGLSLLSGASKQINQGKSSQSQPRFSTTEQYFGSITPQSPNTKTLQSQRNSFGPQDSIDTGSFPDPGSPNFDHILKSKVEFCKTCDTKTRLAMVKTKFLNQILGLFHDQSIGKHLSPQAINTLFDLVVYSITRSIPSEKKLVFPFDYLLSLIDPEWKYLFQVYNILNKMIDALPLHPKFDLRFWRIFLEVSSVPFQAERAQIVMIVKKFLTVHPEKKPPFLNIILSFLVPPAIVPYQISTMLCLLSTIDFFDKTMLKETVNQIFL